jgi:hydrogenase maturation protease
VPTDPPTTAPVLVGGVGELYQQDLDVGRWVVERLEGERPGPHVVVEDLHYGAVAVAQRLQDLRPGTLVLVGAARRGRPPGHVERRRLQDDPGLTPEELQVAVGDAVTGYVAIDLVVAVALALGGLPARTVAVEVEPVETASGEHLSPAVAARLDDLLALVRAEVRRAPLLELADRLRHDLSDGRLSPSPARGALHDVLVELEGLDADARWGAAFARRDRLRHLLGRGDVGPGMEHLDWGLWWALVEELDRLQLLESGLPGHHRSV